MKITIKPKGYPKRVFEVEYSAISRSDGPDAIKANLYLRDEQIVTFKFTKGSEAPVILWGLDSHKAHEVMPYLSQLYGEIKKHCETWLAHPVEPFPWETDQEFKNSMDSDEFKK